MVASLRRCAGGRRALRPSDLRACARRGRAMRISGLALAVAGALALCPPAAPAATFTAACSGGSGDVGSLRAAITVANTNLTADTVSLGAGCRYALGEPDNNWYGPNGLPPIASDITIEGNGATIARGPGAARSGCCSSARIPPPGHAGATVTPGPGEADAAGRDARRAASPRAGTSTAAGAPGHGRRDLQPGHGPDRAQHADRQHRPAAVARNRPRARAAVASEPTRVGRAHQGGGFGAGNFRAAPRAERQRRAAAAGRRLPRHRGRQRARDGAGAGGARRPGPAGFAGFRERRRTARGGGGTTRGRRRRRRRQLRRRRRGPPGSQGAAGVGGVGGGGGIGGGGASRRGRRWRRLRRRRRRRPSSRAPATPAAPAASAAAAAAAPGRRARASVVEPPPSRASGGGGAGMGGAIFNMQGRLDDPQLHARRQRGRGRRGPRARRAARGWAARCST